MKKNFFLFLGCVVLTAVMVFNVQLVKSDFSNGSDVSLSGIFKIALAQTDEIKDSTKNGYWKNYEGLGDVCVPTGTTC